jgi:hypothetical protein
MMTNELLDLLAGLARRLASIADQAQETCAQAQHTLDRVNRLRQELDQVSKKILSIADTGEHKPLGA